jgi:hypothetical protein
LFYVLTSQFQLTVMAKSTTQVVKTSQCHVANVVGRRNLSLVTTEPSTQEFNS